MDVVIRDKAVILEVFAGKGESLVLRGNAFPTVDLDFEGLDGVIEGGVEGEGLVGRGFDKDLQGFDMFPLTVRVDASKMHGA